MTMPEEYGSMGLGLTEAGIILHEIAESGGGASGASAFHYCNFPPGRDPPRLARMKKYLPLLASGGS